jgi:hypothetical protein
VIKKNLKKQKDWDENRWPNARERGCSDETLCSTKTGITWRINVEKQD